MIGPGGPVRLRPAGSLARLRRDGRRRRLDGIPFQQRVPGGRQVGHRRCRVGPRHVRVDDPSARSKGPGDLVTVRTAADAEQGVGLVGRTASHAPRVLHPHEPVNGVCRPWARHRAERVRKRRWWRWGRVELPVQNPSPGTKLRACPMLFVNRSDAHRQASVRPIRVSLDRALLRSTQPLPDRTSAE